MRKLMEKIEKTFMAAAFAEADCHDTALEILDTPATRRSSRSLDDFLRDVGLDEVRYSYVLARV